jgi:hypothetical protein
MDSSGFYYYGRAYCREKSELSKLKNENDNAFLDGFFACISAKS